MPVRGGTGGRASVARMCAPTEKMPITCVFLSNLARIWRVGKVEYLMGALKKSSHTFTLTRMTEVQKSFEF